MKKLFILLILFIPSVSYGQWLIHDTVAIENFSPTQLDYFSGVELICNKTYTTAYVHDPPGSSTPTRIDINLTSNDGLTWKTVFSVSDYGIGLNTYQFINADTGFVWYGNYAYVNLKKTTDGGINWQYMNIDHKNLSFISGEKGYGMSGNVFIKYENDSLFMGDTIPDVIAPFVIFTKYEAGYCVSKVQAGGDLQYHKVLRTTDDGENWNFSLIDTLHTIKGLSAPTQSSCFILCDQGVLYKSNNSGHTWTQFTANGLDSITHLTFVDELNGYIVDNNRLYRTVDGGDTWNEQTIPAGLSVKSIMMVNDSVAYLYASSLKAIYRFNIILKTLNGRTQGIFESKKGRNILHVYPNPTKSDVRLEVPSDLKESVLSVYDMNGTLMLNYQVQNTTLLIDVSPFLPGTYLGILRKDNLIQRFKIIKE